MSRSAGSHRELLTGVTWRIECGFFEAPATLIGLFWKIIEPARILNFEFSIVKVRA